jgi:hypothetical protein
MRLGRRPALPRKDKRIRCGAVAVHNCNSKGLAGRKALLATVDYDSVAWVIRIAGHISNIHAVDLNVRRE